MWYRRGLELIFAMQWDGTLESLHAIELGMPDVMTQFYHFALPDQNAKSWRIGHPPKCYDVQPGDFILRNEHGDIYPCKPGVFNALFKEVKQ